MTRLDIKLGIKWFRTVYFGFGNLLTFPNNIVTQKIANIYFYTTAKEGGLCLSSVRSIFL